jgi:acyl-CoA thioester hydrolase
MSDWNVTYRDTVYPWQCDHMGHMNVMWYVGKFDEASWHLISELGLTRARFEHEGAGMAMVEQRIEYRRELQPGDIITIRSKVLEVKDKTIRLTHEMKNDDTGEVAARTDIVAVHIDTALRKARPLPTDVRERAARMIGCENVESTNSDDISNSAGRPLQPASIQIKADLVAPGASAPAFLAPRSSTHLGIERNSIR